MPHFRKKPVVIEAIQFIDRPEAMRALSNFLPDGIAPRSDTPDGPLYIIIPTLEGDHRADEGDWIIRGIAGEFYPCKPDIFESTYEEVSS